MQFYMCVWTALQKVHENVYYENTEYIQISRIFLYQNKLIFNPIFC